MSECSEAGLQSCNRGHKALEEVRWGPEDRLRTPWSRSIRDAHGCHLSQEINKLKTISASTSFSESLNSSELYDQKFGPSAILESELMASQQTDLVSPDPRNILSGSSSDSIHGIPVF